RDRNLWHLSHEGADLEDPANEPRDDLWVMSVPVSRAPDQPEYLELRFENGNPVALNGERLPGHELIAALNALGGRHAVGQTQLASFAMSGYDVTAARGFIDLFGLPMKVNRLLRQREE